jgi:small subunit ribosomal protein S15
LRRLNADGLCFFAEIRRNSVQVVCLIIYFLKMAVYYSKEKVASIVKEYGGEGNTGNTEAQVALLTYRIECLSAHLRVNKKDHSTRRALLTMVGQRKSLLGYYAKKDIYKYRALIEKLGLRK